MHNQIFLQNVVGAFLKNGNQYLLIKRSKDKKIAPNVWSCIGGHVEPVEINDPKKAVLREIEEETGIKKEDVSNLKLRYVITRRDKDVVRQNYIYFGQTEVTELITTYEGTLHWIDENELLNKTFSSKYFKVIEHFVKKPDSLERIVVGVAENFNGQLKMNWTVLEDFE